ncbi:unnamed protein product [Dibothriocephalus latus]|uniref:Uncharacterized protein n=1 Tax=Dibothriocephalus latus TaxID=60516 RepID=A0A3P7LXT1_DIBLA|nr:unnamed protein product [Dibothriocephalus latus]
MHPFTADCTIIFCLSVKKFRGKGKSAHDLVNDPRLSSEPVTVSAMDDAASLSASNDLLREAEERRRRREDAANLETAEEREARAQRLYAVEAAIKESKPLVSDLGDFKDEVATYRSKTKQLRARKDREAETMNLLSRFESRLLSEIQAKEATDSEKKAAEEESAKAAAKDEAVW